MLSVWPIIAELRSKYLTSVALGMTSLYSLATMFELSLTSLAEEELNESQQWSDI